MNKEHYIAQLSFFMDKPSPVQLMVLAQLYKYNYVTFGASADLKSLGLHTVSHIINKTNLAGDENVLTFYEIVAKMSQVIGESGMFDRLEMEGNFKQSGRFHILWAQSHASEGNQRKAREIVAKAHERMPEMDEELRRQLDELLASLDTTAPADEQFEDARQDVTKIDFILSDTHKGPMDEKNETLFEEIDMDISEATSIIDLTQATEETLDSINRTEVNESVYTALNVTPNQLNGSDSGNPMKEINSPKTPPQVVIAVDSMESVVENGDEATQDCSYFIRYKAQLDKEIEEVKAQHAEECADPKSCRRSYCS